MHPNLPVDRRTRSRVGLQRVEDVIVLNHADEDKILNRINPLSRWLPIARNASNVV